MVFGHLSANFLAVTAFSKKATAPVICAALVGGYFPDILDKGSVMVLGLGAERGLGHTLTFNLIFSGLSYFVTRRFLRQYSSVVIWFLIGSWLHLLEDLVKFRIFFWPFLGELPPPLHYSLRQMCENFYVKRVNLPVFVFEMACHAALAAYLVARLIGRRRQLVLDKPTPNC